MVNHKLAGPRKYERKRKLLNSIGYELGEGTRVVGPIFCTGKLIVGKNCFLGRDLTINGNGTVIIGDNCDIAPSVMFLTGGHEIGSFEHRAGKGEKYTVRVESGTWIGARSTLGKNITVGQGCVVGTCSCVLKNVEEHCLVGGVPAKIIRKFDDHGESS